MRQVRSSGSFVGVTGAVALVALASVAWQMSLEPPVAAVVAAGPPAAVAAPAPPARTAPRAPIPPRRSAPRAPEDTPHLLTVPVAGGATPGDTPRPAALPGLEDALHVEDGNPVWTAAIRAEVEHRLAIDAALVVDDVRCAQSLCRLRLIRPDDAALDWPHVDEALADVTTGETIFATEPQEGQSVAYVYFSAEDTRLPL